MADAKISALPASTTPLAGTEVLPIVQSGVTKKVSVADLTAGRATSVSTLGVGTASPVTALSNTNASYAGGTAADGLLWRTLQNDWGVVLVASPAAGAGYALRTHTNDATSSSYPLAVSSGAGSGTFKFSVQGDGTTTVTGGNLVIGTAGKGIDFSADGHAAGMTSELLDDYEEGTWTPVLQGATAGSFSFGAIGTYTKIGRIVNVWFYGANFDLTGAGISGFVELAGLPFNIQSDNSGLGKVAVNNAVTANVIPKAYSGARLRFNLGGTSNMTETGVTQSSGRYLALALTYVAS
jgi:hypothetical protein